MEGFPRVNRRFPHRSAPAERRPQDVVATIVDGENPAASLQNPCYGWRVQSLPLRKQRAAGAIVRALAGTAFAEATP